MIGICSKLCFVLIIRPKYPGIWSFFTRGLDQMLDVSRVVLARGHRVTKDVQAWKVLSLAPLFFLVNDVEPKMVI
jgi:hypothetical protein